jgi:hypothetical protein
MGLMRLGVQDQSGKGGDDVATVARHADGTRSLTATWSRFCPGDMPPTPPSDRSSSPRSAPVDNENTHKGRRQPDWCALTCRHGRLRFTRAHLPLAQHEAYALISTPRANPTTCNRPTRRPIVISDLP